MARDGQRSAYLGPFEQDKIDGLTDIGLNFQSNLALTFSKVDSNCDNIALFVLDKIGFDLNRF